MGIVGEKLNIDFVISTGDNFYDDGLTGVDDPAFYESFVDIYTAPSLQKIWYNGKLIRFQHPLKRLVLRMVWHFYHPVCQFNTFICYIKI